MKIAATVILFNPDDSCLHNILTYYSKVGHLYIYDNSARDSQEIKDWSIHHPNVSYFHSGINEGISKRLNQATEQAIEDGFEWLLTMDQDSYFEESELTKYISYVSESTETHSIAQFGVNVDNNSAENRTNYNIGVNVEHLITSGSIVNLSLVKEIGGFDEDLFIDEVDWEFCFRSILKGYLIVKFPNVSLQHKLGEVHYFLSLKTFKKTPRTLHNPSRLYYVVRNYFYVADMYHKNFEISAKFRKKALINRIKNNLLYSNRRLGTIRNIITGYIDYKRNIKGRNNH